MCIKTELLITFDKYIELIGGKKYETHQNIVDIFNKINKKQKILDQNDIDRLLKTYVRGGENPNDLRAVTQDDPRYPTVNNGPGWIPQNL